MFTHTIHEDEIQPVSLPGRDHKMIIGPMNFGPAKNMCFGLADFPPHKHAPAHVHEESEEILYILTGSGEFYFDDQPEAIKPGTCVFVPPGVVHSINNTSDEVLKVVYVFSPAVIQGSYDNKS
jgi:mannose-6-phosphate isomerase-like protein (cupin superfamily)